MNKFDELINCKIETLIEFQEHIGAVLLGIETLFNYVNKKELKKLEKCYSHLNYMWECIEENISKLIEAKPS